MDKRKFEMKKYHCEICRWMGKRGPIPLLWSLLPLEDKQRLRDRGWSPRSYEEMMSFLDSPALLAWAKRRIKERLDDKA